VNGKTEWSLKNTTNNFWTKAWASTTDAIYYVSTSAYADDAFDGLSHGTTHQTIAHALATPSLDAPFKAPSGGLTFAPRQGLIGLGATASIVVGSGTAGEAVVTLSGSRSSIENMWVRVSAQGGVGVRATIKGSTETPPPTTGTNENSRLTNIFCENQTQNAIAFGIGDNTGLDVSEVVMIGCDSVGNSAMGSIHMRVGDGETANVGDITNIGGNSQDNNYGVVMNGGWLVSRGLNFQGSGTADIWLKQPGVGNISFDGGRSETAARFVVSCFGVLTYTTLKIANYAVVALQNIDGQGVQLLGGGVTTFDNVAMFGANAPQYFLLA
jgi:hypothetical protein